MISERHNGAVAALHQRARGFGQRRQAVGRHFVRHAEGFAADTVEKIAAQRFARGKADGVHEAVEAAPAFAQIGKSLLDFFVALHIAAEHQIGAQLFGHFAHTLFEFVDNISKGKLGALLVACFGDAVSDGALGNHAGNEDFFTLQKAHFLSLAVVLLMH